MPIKERFSVTPFGRGDAHKQHEKDEKMEEDREDFKFRFLGLKGAFWQYVKEQGITPSAAIRHFIKNGLSEQGGFTVAEQKELKNLMIEYKRQHGKVGTNLNQIARYFNQHGHLIESDLHNNHVNLMQNQKDITRLLNKILSKL